MDTLYVYWGIFLNYVNNSYIFTAPVNKTKHIFSCNAKLLSGVFQKNIFITTEMINVVF